MITQQTVRGLGQRWQRKRLSDCEHLLKGSYVIVMMNMVRSKVCNVTGVLRSDTHGRWRNIMHTLEENKPYIMGQLYALRTLANEVRLECTRNHMPMQAAAIKLMQDALLQMHRMDIK